MKRVAKSHFKRAVHTVVEGTVSAIFANSLLQEDKEPEGKEYSSRFCLVATHGIQV